MCLEIRPAGRTYETQKSREKKQDILKLSRAFNGTFSDAEVMRFTGLARKTYYKYKKEFAETESSASHNLA